MVWLKFYLLYLTKIFLKARNWPLNKIDKRLIKKECVLLTHSILFHAGCKHIQTHSKPVDTCAFSKKAAMKLCFLISQANENRMMGELCERKLYVQVLQLYGSQIRPVKTAH